MNLAEQSLFTHQKSTPMHDLRFYLDQFKALPLAYLTPLNRQRYKHTVAGNEEFERREIGFDHVMLFKLRNAKESVSFHFNFTHRDPSIVRATVKMGENQGVEYSPEYTVAEMRELMKSFLATFESMDHRIKSSHRAVASEAFARAFAKHFQIRLSSSLNPGEVRSMKMEFLGRHNGLGDQIRALTAKIEACYDTIDFKSESGLAGYHALQDERDSLCRKSGYMRQFELYNYPAVVRGVILKTMESKMVRED